MISRDWTTLVSQLAKVISISEWKTKKAVEELMASIGGKHNLPKRVIIRSSAKDMLKELLKLNYHVTIIANGTIILDLKEEGPKPA